MSQDKVDDDDKGRLVMDLDAPRSLSPEPEEDEERHNYYLAYYQHCYLGYQQWSLDREP